METGRAGSAFLNMARRISVKDKPWKENVNVFNNVSLQYVMSIQMKVIITFQP